jgi:hypothetical protein
MNLQQQQLLMQHVRGSILSPSLLSTGSSCSASVNGSSNSRSHMTGNFSNSSLSLASDTRDPNGENLCTGNVKWVLCGLYLLLSSRAKY